MRSLLSCIPPNWYGNGCILHSVGGMGLRFPRAGAPARQAGYLRLSTLRAITSPSVCTTCTSTMHSTTETTMTSPWKRW